MGMRQLATALIDLVLPDDCAGCAAPRPPWCPACRPQLGPPTAPEVPGGPVIVAVGRYEGPLRTALLRYKERDRRDLAGPLAELLDAPLAELVAEPVADRGPQTGAAGPGGVWLVPAPSRPAAARARGGDHVARLCHELAAGRPDLHVARPLRLARRARDSVGLDAAQRVANLAGRLRVRESQRPPAGAAVVLVDDVVTTGATLRACRGALAHAGIRADRALVLCDATTRRHRR